MLIFINDDIFLTRLSKLGLEQRPKLMRLAVSDRDGNNIDWPASLECLQCVPVKILSIDDQVSHVFLIEYGKHTFEDSNLLPFNLWCYPVVLAVIVVFHLCTAGWNVNWFSISSDGFFGCPDVFWLTFPCQPSLMKSFSSFISFNNLPFGLFFKITVIFFLVSLHWIFMKLWQKKASVPSHPVAFLWGTNPWGCIIVTYLSTSIIQHLWDTLNTRGIN